MEQNGEDVVRHNLARLGVGFIGPSLGFRGFGVKGLWFAVWGSKTLNPKPNEPRV